MSGADIAFAGCKWIEGEAVPLRLDLYCGKTTLIGKDWCEKHFALAYTKRVRRHT